MEEESVTIGNHLIYFAVVNLALTLCYSIAFILFDIDSNTSVVIGAMIAAAMVT